MEKAYFGSYRMVVRDYFREFISGFCMEKVSFLILFLGFGSIVLAGWADRISMDGVFANWICGIPVFYALLSGALHRVSLPFMLYLVPCSRKQRERYIQRMLAVKVAAPMAFGGLCDVAAACAGALTPYVFVLQMAGIFFISCLCGMVSEGGMHAAGEKTAYGELLPFAAVILAICNIVGMALFIICMDSVSQVEFWVIFSVMMLLLVPMVVAVGKRWKQVRSNYADYETAAGAAE